MAAQRRSTAFDIPPEANASGWYIWSGDLSDAADFFKPIHLEHLADLIPAAVPYLSLPAGWRFQIAPGHEDVWQDDSLLNLQD